MAPASTPPNPFSDSHESHLSASAPSSRDENRVNLLELTAKAALFSAVEQPLEGGSQLLHKVLGFVPEVHFAQPAAEKFGSAGWLAETVGSGLGFALPFMGTDALVGKSLAKLGIADSISPLGRSLISGATTGFAFSPSNDSGNFWEQRSINAATSSLMFGVQAGAAGALNKGIEGLRASTIGSTEMGTLQRAGQAAITNSLSGALGGTVSAETNSLLSGNGNASFDSLKQSAIAGAATGFVLSATSLRHAGQAGETKAPPNHNDYAAANEMPHMSSHLAGEQHGNSGDFELYSQLAQNAKRAGDPAYAEATPHPKSVEAGANAGAVNSVQPIDWSLADQLPFQAHSRIGTDTTSGASTYAIDVNGGQRVFMQTSAGRIIERRTMMDGSVVKVWNPYGINDQTSFVRESSVSRGGNGSDLPAGHIEKMDEALGLQMPPDGTMPAKLRTADTRDSFNLPQSTIDGSWSKDSLVLAPKMIEDDTQAARRLVPASDGKTWQRYSLTIDVPTGEVAPEGISYPDFKKSYLKSETIPARRYKVLSDAALGELDQLALRKPSMSAAEYDKSQQRIYRTATSVVVPEEYAQKLDAVRELRRVGTLAPESNPQLADQILAARRRLYTSDYADRLTPEHVGQMLDMIPNRLRMSEVLMWDGPSALDQWARQRDPNYSGRSLEANTRTGGIKIFGRFGSVGQGLQEGLMHEWVHLTEPDYPELLDASAATKTLEPFSGNEYAHSASSEFWAVHGGEMFLSPNPDVFLSLASHAPIRTAIFARAVQDELNSMNTAHANEYSRAREGSQKTAIENRLQFVRDKVMPIASQNFSDALFRGTPQQMADAGRIAEMLYGTKKQDLLENLGFNRSELQRAIKTGLEDGLSNKAFDAQEAMRTLMQFELLQKLEPDMVAYSTRQYNKLLDKTTSAISKQLSSGSADEKSQAVAAMQDARELNEQGFDSGISKALAQRVPPQAVSQAAKQVLEVSTNTNDRISSLMWLFGTASSSDVATAQKFVQNNVQFDSQLANSLRFTQYLSSLIDDNIRRPVDAANQEANQRTTMRGAALVDVLLNNNHSTLDYRMTIRLQNLKKLKDAMDANKSKP